MLKAAKSNLTILAKSSMQKHSLETIWWRNVLVEHYQQSSLNILSYQPDFFSHINFKESIIYLNVNFQRSHFDSNFEIRCDFTNNLQESCWEWSEFYVSPSNVLQTLVLPAWFHQNGKADFVNGLSVILLRIWNNFLEKESLKQSVGWFGW